MDDTESSRGRNENEAYEDETYDRAVDDTPAERASSDPDVLLDVPELRVEEITLDVDDLRARVSLNAEVLDLLGLGVGADVSLGGVHLDIKGVEARALLKVRLDNVAAIVDRVLTTVDRNPRILERASSELRAATERLGGGVERAAEGLGSGAGTVIEETGDRAGKALEGTGETVERAVGETAETARGVTGSTRATDRPARDAPGKAPARPRRERAEPEEHRERAERPRREDTGSAPHRLPRERGRRRGSRPP